jgi:glyoxylate/hydroxypyruvate reductase A
VTDNRTAEAPCIALLSSGLDLEFLVPALRSQCPGVDLRQTDALGDLDDIDAAVCWSPPAGLLARMPNLKLIQSIAAGVDHILSDPDLPPVPVCRVIDPGMAAGMSAYVLWAVIHQARHFDRYLMHASRRRWQPEPIVAPARPRVGIAGFGWLGSACARALVCAGFSVRAWHRGTQRPVPPGVALFHGGDQLDEFLSGCDSLVCMLPLTAQTTGFLSARLFGQLPRGAHLINVGRGAHLVEEDLLAAIASGQVGSATLDTFTREPLPPEHPFWSEQRITITPHIASRTERAVIVQQTLANLAQVRQGLRPAAAVDPGRGY